MSSPNSEPVNLKSGSNAIPIPEELKPHLTILLTPVIIPICTHCQHAVLPLSLLDHLRKQHQLPSSLRPPTRTLISTLPPLTRTSLPAQRGGSTPIPELRIVDAFQCNQCPFIRRDLTDVRKHINTTHSLSASNNYSKILAQSWFGGRRADYWRVSDVDQDPDQVKARSKDPEKACGEAEAEACENEVAMRDWDDLWDEKIGIHPSEGACEKEQEQSQLSKYHELEQDTGPHCMWGFFGKGFGDKTPRSYPRYTVFIGNKRVIL